MNRIFPELTASRLGFGTMRLPVREDKSIDEEELDRMVAYALAHGVNYFDTAYPYHGGMSERAVGKALSKYPRESYCLATKYPGHQIAQEYHPAEIFEEQLEKCGVEYFDFYLLHNVCENDIEVYMDPKWGIIPYFLEQRRLGRIRHLGFSTHARPDTLEKFLNDYGDEMDFCQIQLNYLDWTLQDAKKKYELLTEHEIPVWVMEPVRGGKLAQLSETQEQALIKIRPNESIAAWAFRWLQQLPNVRMVLSGMSNMAQMEDNIRTFSEQKPLTQEENELLLNLAEGMKKALPCTACRYCCDGCPMELDIPMLLHAYNDFRYQAGFTVPMQMDALAEDKRPSACIGCGACAQVCPQKIDIPAAMADFAERLKNGPSWAQICRQREEENRKNQKR
ncbi:MAG: aldo/keto reductase [Clostridia bacterium]|nr:aldo/keto reductase [Clostridia bacterium]